MQSSLSFIMYWYGSISMYLDLDIAHKIMNDMAVTDPKGCPLYVLPLRNKIFTIPCSFWGKSGKFVFWCPAPGRFAPSPMENSGSTPAWSIILCSLCIVTVMNDIKSRYLDLYVVHNVSRSSCFSQRCWSGSIYE